MTEPKPGVYVYDFGQNFSGVERLRVQGPAGTDVRCGSRRF
jgi:alpha-L-rhamnosidase